jgi:hypothetical protein
MKGHDSKAHRGGKPKQKPVSLTPLSFEEALEALVRVKPPKPKKASRAPKKDRDSKPSD